MRNYFIKKSSNEIFPEEILLDKRIKQERDQYSRLEFPVKKYQIYLLLGLSLVFLVSVAAASSYYQIFRFSVLSAQAQENKLKQFLVEAPRGIILDRYGEVLAENKVSYDLLVISEELPDQTETLQQEIELLSNIFSVGQEEIQTKLQSPEKLKNQTLFKGINTEQALKVQVNEERLPGFKLVGKFSRFYPFGKSASQVLGHTGMASESDVQTNAGLILGETIGKSGLESQYDGLLRGKRGSLSYEVNALRNPVQDERVEYYQTGQTLTLTLDAELQEKIYSVLNNFTANRSGGAAGIALNPQTGEVLALVSVPSFDNNLLSSGISSQELQTLLNSAKQPFFNRAVSGEYSPGSTIKPFLALAALQENIIDPERKIDDTEGRIVIPNPYFPDKPSIFRDWKVHGWVNMREAIGDSCDVYFYTIGGGYGDIKGLGVEKIKSSLEKFGWGKLTGIDLPGEKTGFLPDPDWKEKVIGEPWRIGDTYNLSIGQGYIRTTPIQLITTMAGMINGGKQLRPFILKESEDLDTFSLGAQVASSLSQETSINPSQLQIIKEGMRRTVTHGSASSLISIPLEVAGKTGSVQTSSSLENTNALFISFTNLDNPDFMLLVLVEGGGGGGATAVPLSREILDWYWQNRVNNSLGKRV